jgi:hypothetical protein
MIKATFNQRDGRPTLLLGLSFANLDKLRAAPGDSFIKVDGREVGNSHDIWIVAGETEAHLANLIAPGIGADTKVHVSAKLKS